MHRSRLGNIVIDCNTHDLLADARFWSQALGYPLPEKIDGDSPFIQLQTPPGEVQVIIQRVQHEARAHLDIDSDSISAEVARLQRLGAQVVTRKDAWVVMQAPSGHRFCVGSPYRAGFDEHANHWNAHTDRKA
ncbi:VOC family protein [Pseudomonas yangonensis]|uniref:VOC family protein n=1 Tax=Pseudomonas yangonensis TaxID=2579922 RepID=UPI00137B4AC5|nr:VOC family protein [Pseudomonas yangonensis]